MTNITDAPKPETAKPEMEAEAVSAMPDQDFENELAKLRKEVTRLNSHRFVRIHNSVFLLLLFQLLRGMAFGLGTLLGATLLVSMIVYSLSSIDFIPVIGEWASEIVDIITNRTAVD
ncbi:DUF5665 domain-containing protein [Halocynthiibacter namhaensis]|uniref:DUF5665 domain-containing protein n=1 Tax=Halocynthiibacter namhaensis TaxID=1290553 RepID=UPI001EE287AD|nr:DUF5665 domain-containing protein [Halocynthiibacter namhaensis]